MVINNFNVIGYVTEPFKTDAILCVDANAMLPMPIPFQCFKTITRWNSQIIEHFGRVQLLQLSCRNTPQIAWASFPRSL